MKFNESILFAGIMTLLEDYQNDNETLLYIGEQNNQNEEYNILEIKKRLICFAQDLLDTADGILHTDSNIITLDFLPQLICAILFEAVDSAYVSNEKKREIYDVLVNGCDCNSELSGRLLFAPRIEEMANALNLLAYEGVGVFVVAAYESGIEDMGFSFVKMFTGFLLSLEIIMTKYYPTVVLNKRPSLLVVEHAISTLENKLKELKSEK